MNRQIKILSIVTAVSVLFVMILFFIALDDYDYDVLVTLKYFWIVFLFPVFFGLLLRQQKQIQESPIKEELCDIVNLQIDYDAHTRTDNLLATFRTSNNLQWTFNVPLEIFNKLVIGRRGILSYRERKSKLYFVFFTVLPNEQ